MALKLTVEKLEDVEETLRPLYAEKDGKFHLGVEGLPDTTADKKTIENLRRVEKERGVEIEKWRKLGKSQEDIEKAFVRLEELEQLTLEKKGDFESLKAQLVEKQQEQLKKSDKRAADAEAKAERIERERDQERLDNLIKDAISVAKGRVKALMPIVRQFIDTEREGGAVKYVVKENGVPKLNLEGPRQGEPMTIAELIADLSEQEEYAGNFLGTGSSGGGARPPAGGKRPPHGISRKKDFGTGIEGAKKIEQFLSSFPTVELGTKAYQDLPD